MPIPIACACGKSRKVDDDFAGKTVRCDQCGDAIAVPPPPPGSKRTAGGGDPFHLLTLEPRPAPSNLAELHPWETAIQDRPSLPEPAPLPRPNPRRTTGDYADVDLEPPHRRGGGMNSGIAGGLLTIGIAVLWFFVGLAFGRFFVYPLVMFVLGCIALIKGLFGNET